jgi:cytochrome b561
MTYRYPALTRVLHWLTAAGLLAVVALGLSMTWYEPKREPLKFLLYDVHESTGVALFVVVLLRLIRRLAAPPGPLPQDIPWHFRAAAHANHAMLYAVLLIQPVIGFFATNAWGFPLVWAGWLPIPSPLGKNQTLAPMFSAMPGYTALTLVLLVGAHLGGACYHGVIRRDGVVRRML